MCALPIGVETLSYSEAIERLTALSEGFTNAKLHNAAQFLALVRELIRHQHSVIEHMTRKQQDIERREKYAADIFNSDYVPALSFVCDFDFDRSG